jgi:hypothetical protein
VRNLLIIVVVAILPAYLLLTTKEQRIEDSIARVQRTVDAAQARVDDLRKWDREMPHTAGMDHARAMNAECRMMPTQTQEAWTRLNFGSDVELCGGYPASAGDDARAQLPQALHDLAEAKAELAHWQKQLDDLKAQTK